MSSTRWSPAWRARLLAGDEPPWLTKHPRRKRLIAVALATPPWVDRRALARLRERAQELTRRTGVRWVVDHEIPVQHPYVCGLTVPWNLRVIPERVNQAKSAAWTPDQTAFDLLVVPMQLGLELRP